MPATIDTQADENPFGELASPVYVSDNPFGDLASPLGADQGEALGIQLKKNPLKRRRIPGIYDAEQGPVPSVKYGPFTPGMVGSGMLQSGLDIGSVLARAAPMGATGDEFQHAAQNIDAERQQAAEQLGASNPTQYAEQFGRGMVRSLMPMVVTSKLPLPRAIAAAGPIAAGGAIQGSQSLTESRDQGMPEAEARKFALQSAAVEAGTEALFARYLPTFEKTIATGMASGLTAQQALLQPLKMMASEAGQELATEAGHLTNEWLSSVNNDQHTPALIARRLLTAAAQGALMSGGLAGGHAAISAAESAMQPKPDDALQSRLDTVQWQYVKDEQDRKDTAAWREQFAQQQDLDKSASAYRTWEADKRQQQQEADKAALDKFYRERMPQEVPPETIGGIRQLPISPDTEMPSPTEPPAVEQPADQTLPLPLQQGTSEQYDPQAYKQAEARLAELQSLTLPQLNQAATQYGLPKSLNKARQLQAIVAHEQTLTDAVSQTQAAMEKPKRMFQKKGRANAAPTGIEPTNGQQQYQRTEQGPAPSENGAEVRPTESSPDRHSDSAIQGVAQEAVVPKAEVTLPTHKMLDFDSRGRLKARTEMPADQAHRLLRGREVVFQKLLECLT